MQGKFVILLTLSTLYVASGKDIGVIVEPVCPENEEWNLCGELCAPTCDLPKPNPRWCPRIRCSEFTSGCKCVPGLVRDVEGSGKCILVEDCNKALLL